jgi:hypothetical protein
VDYERETMSTKGGLSIVKEEDEFTFENSRGDGISLGS